MGTEEQLTAADRDIDTTGEGKGAEAAVVAGERVGGAAMEAEGAAEGVGAMDTAADTIGRVEGEAATAVSTAAEEAAAG